MSAAESDLLFINKTARSEKLSRSRGLERARIYSHVQRGCHNQAPRKLSNQDEVLCYPLESWSSEPNKPGSRSHPRPSGGKRSLTRGCKTKMHGEVDSTAGALRTFHISARPLQLGPSNPLNGGAGDPFDSLRVPISPYMEGLLKFCKLCCRFFKTLTYQVQTAAMSCLASSQSRKWPISLEFTPLCKLSKILCSASRCCVPRLRQYMPIVVSLGMALLR